LIFQNQDLKKIVLSTTLLPGGTEKNLPGLCISFSKKRVLELFKVFDNV